MGTLSQETVDKIRCADINHLRTQHASTVDYITEKIAYEDFFLNHMLPNKPCVFGSYVTERWKSLQEWITGDGKPDFEFLLTHFGNCTVPVADCNKVQYDAQPKRDTTLTEYVQYWRDYMANGHTSEQGCLYLKDWHFAHVFPDYLAYETPVFFTSDWLNEFWDTRADRSDDDYRFVYMGPKGSWTPFHADVFRSFSWSANICGRKKWILFPPGQEEHLKDNLGNLAYDVTSSEMHDGNKYCDYTKACQPLEVIQEAGEVIFVPSGWHHQVFNLEDTMSINHNWLNGCNIDIMWEFLQKELCAVQRSISDCKDMDGWHSQCQLIMKASTGIDYSEFFQFVHTIAKRRMHQLKRPSQDQDEDNCASALLDLDLGPKIYRHGDISPDQVLKKECIEVHNSDIDQIDTKHSEVNSKNENTSCTSKLKSETEEVDSTPLQTIPVDTTSFVDITLQITPVLTSSYVHTPEGSSYYEGSTVRLLKSSSDEDITDSNPQTVDSWSSGCSAKTALLMHKTLRTTPVQHTSYVDISTESRNVEENCDVETDLSSEQTKCSFEGIIPPVNETDNESCSTDLPKEHRHCKTLQTTPVERTSYVSTSRVSTGVDNASLDTRHAVFDLDRIKQVLDSLMRNDEFLKLDMSLLCYDPSTLQRDVLQVLEELITKK